MKKFILSLILVSTLTLPAFATVDRYPVYATSDSTPLITSFAKYWRWLETRVHLTGANTTFTVTSKVVSSGVNNISTVISVVTTDTATTDVVVYPGATRLGAPVGGSGTTFLLTTDEMRTEVTGHGTRTPNITVIGEEI